MCTSVVANTTTHDRGILMIKSLVNILVHPDAFFRDVLKEKENLKNPGLIVVVLGIVSAAYAYLIGGLTGKMLAGNASRHGIDNRYYHNSWRIYRSFLILGDMDRCILPHINDLQG